MRIHKKEIKQFSTRYSQITVYAYGHSRKGTSYSLQLTAADGRTEHKVSLCRTGNRGMDTRSRDSECGYTVSPDASISSGTHGSCLR